MTATFVFTNTIGYEFGPLPATFPDANFTTFTLDIANTSAIETESGVPFQKKLIDGWVREIPVEKRWKQKIDTLPNLVLAGISDGTAYGITTYRSLLESWYYARARWIQTYDFGGPVQIVRTSENLPFVQLGGISFAVQASFEVQTAGTDVTPGTWIPMQIPNGVLRPNDNQTDTVLYERPVALFGGLVGSPYNGPNGGANAGNDGSVRGLHLIRDIVFTRYENSQEVFSFNLGTITRASAPIFEELTVPSALGPTGTGIWKITADLPLFDNNRWTINQLKRLLGLPLHMQVLYKTGVCTGTIALDSSGNLSDGGNDSDGYATQRFNNLLNYRSIMGVTVQVKDESADYRRPHLIISGATAQKFDYFMSSTSSFYGLFKKLNTQ